MENGLRGQLVERRGQVTMSRDRRVRRVLIIEGLANPSITVAKATVGVTTGSTAVLGDAVHSLRRPG